MPRGLGTTQKKILLLLRGGASLFLYAGYSPRKQLSVIEAIGEEWEKIDRINLARAIRALYRSKMTDFREKGNGRVAITITDAGKEKLLEYDIDNLKIKKPRQWDKKWRIICFDIPKNKKKVREAFRSHLRRLGFRSLQKSVFIFPYPCDDEIEFLIEVYGVRAYVRQIEALSLDNELHLRRIFGLK